MSVFEFLSMYSGKTVSRREIRHALGKGALACAKAINSMLKSGWLTKNGNLYVVAR